MSTASAQSKSAVVSNDVVTRVAQFVTYIAAIVLLPLCIVAATKFASSAFEILSGVVMAGILAVAMVVLGMVIPIATAQRQT